jgi:hypothetical protein
MLFNYVFCKFVVPLWVDECYDLNKKLSQYDSFWYLSKFDASCWIFEKYFVVKNYNRWWFMS